jgi:outer membrane protein OmpA-like peptidoglycan-associated protein/tetratricopeptide (TPR) repeat protein
MSISFATRIIFILILCLQVTLLHSQQEISQTANARESLKIAQQLLSEQEFDQAEKQLWHTIKLKKDFAIAYRLLGKLYLDTGQYEAAITALEKSFEVDEKLSRAAFFECGEAYLRLSRPDIALFYFTKYEMATEKGYANKKKESGLEAEYDFLLEKRKGNCAYLSRLDTSLAYAPALFLGKSLNSSYDEYMPAVINRGSKMVFTRSEKGGNENILYSPFRDSSWQKPRRLADELNTPLNEGMARFASSGNSLFFAGCQREDSRGSCDLYQALIDEKVRIKNVRPLPGDINSVYWDSQPSISCDGTQLFFSSTRPGGMGGADIWYSQRKANGDWGKPENLGAAINTEGDEEGPFMANDGESLYFASDGHPGQGETDLFLSRRVNGEWMTPENLGYPINSPCKEMGLHLHENGRSLFFGSARPGGAGGLDLYRSELPPELRPSPTVLLQGYVFDQQSSLPLEVSIKIRSVSGQWDTHSDTTGFFFLCLPGNRGYTFVIEEKTYQPLMQAVYLEDIEEVQEVKLPLVPVSGSNPKAPGPSVESRERRIQCFFEFDSYELTFAVQNDLKELAVFLKNDPQWKVEIVGYADKKGDSKYNYELSRQRAKTIADFLLMEGITSKSIIKSEGMGIDQKAKNDLARRRVDIILRKE